MTGTCTSKTSPMSNRYSAWSTNCTNSTIPAADRGTAPRTNSRRSTSGLLDRGGGVPLVELLVRGIAVVHFREDPLAVGPESEQSAQAQADHVGADVVGQRGSEAQDVVAEP